MPFPHSPAIAQAMADAQTLLRQYDQLTETHERTIEEFRAQRDRALSALAAKDDALTAAQVELLAARQERDALRARLAGMLAGANDGRRETTEALVARLVAEALAKAKGGAKGEA